MVNEQTLKAKKETTYINIGRKIKLILKFIHLCQKRKCQKLYVMVAK
jgi:hypothetical protein